MKKEFRSFVDARNLIQSLRLKNQKSWITYCKSGKKPNNIPTNPNVIYKKEWKGVGDWLGTGRVADQNKEFLSFKEAKKFVHKLKIKGEKQWREYCASGNKPDNIPASPGNTYKKEWIGVGDWLGTGNVANFNKNYDSFSVARRFVHKLNLKSEKQWREYRKSGNKPDNIPTNPERRYKKEWKGMGDWLGTGRISDQERSKNFLSFSDAKTVVQKLATKYNLKTNADWNKAVKDGLIPDTIPASPWYVYSKKREK
jgi:hypothetical protein